MHLNHHKPSLFELCPAAINLFGQPCSWRGLLRWHYSRTRARVLNADDIGRTRGWRNSPALGRTDEWHWLGRWRRAGVGGGACWEDVMGTHWKPVSLLLFPSQKVTLGPHHELPHPWTALSKSACSMVGAAVQNVPCQFSWTREPTCSTCGHPCDAHPNPKSLGGGMSPCSLDMPSFLCPLLPLGRKLPITQH